MSACAICLDQLKAPVALPCGHIYCQSCISETVKAAASTSSSIVHCPTCREPVSTAVPHTLLIPPHLRPYILPPFRRVYLNPPAPILASPPPDTDRASKLSAQTDKAVARLHMENAVLRQSCHAWHARAHAHMTAHFHLSALVRTARDQARKLKDDRDEIARKYDSLKRKFSDVNRDLEQESKTNREENVLIWNEAIPRAQDEDEVPTPPEDVSCAVRLIAPVPGAISAHELQGNSKRPRTSPAAVYREPEILTKPATSIPAMIIPHQCCRS